MTSKILLVEDDRNFGDVLRSYLEMHDFEVTLATDGEAGLIEYNKGSFELCIFDVMMPKKDGFTLAREIRDKGAVTPIIFPYSKEPERRCVRGFKIGADDYITKPFNSEELLYRIMAILKRSSKAAEPKEEAKEFQIGGYLFNYPLRTLVYKDGEYEEKLSPKEAHLLKMFCLAKMTSWNVLRH